MKRSNYFVLLTVLLFGFLLLMSISCTRDQLDDPINRINGQYPKVSIEWTGYKFPNFEDRVGVKGSFELFEYSFTENTSNILDQLIDSEIRIFTNSVTVGNSSTKTLNVSRHFFSYFSSYIECKVNSITQESAEIAISINDVTKYVTFQVELDKGNKVLKMSGIIEDLMVFGAQNAFAQLNKVCGVFHDGFVWPDVSINVIIEDYDLLSN